MNEQNWTEQKAKKKRNETNKKKTFTEYEERKKNNNQRCWLMEGREKYMFTKWTD